ncbi:Type-2 restriction enzyme SmaI [Neorhizobium galegae bv. officinalis]|uniref:Type-2 restriction enzyme SmaI n=1 Tax=Neorhizobium galegae bv. officinalis TaxID=323656 RepID=A0A0T7FKU3_NEOGA|nr:hypothetical protein [Neorhizobium galegae]CDZ35637.1 Type-2 restriction enzyme SmaI [Neorhizobium galegae bv. officinalis]
MNTTVTPAEQRYLDELLKAMRGPCVETIPRDSYLLPEFAQEFRATLLVYHYFLKAPLGTSSFEAAFVRASRAAGRMVSPARDGGRFWDVDIDGRKISLKSTAPKTISKDLLHISKLCEAAWIQDVRGAQQREEATKRLFSEYTGAVDSIVMLRLFRKSSKYEMIEIPTSIFGQVADVPRVHFSADGPTIKVPVESSVPDFRVKLDRSDAKITIAGIRRSVCRVLGTWQLDPTVELEAPPPNEG